MVRQETNASCPGSSHPMTSSVHNESSVAVKAATQKELHWSGLKFHLPAPCDSPASIRWGRQITESDVCRTYREDASLTLSLGGLSKNVRPARRYQMSIDAHRSAVRPFAKILINGKVNMLADEMNGTVAECKMAAAHMLTPEVCL
jgi:hypothetical protein